VPVVFCLVRGPEDVRLRQTTARLMKWFFALFGA
jgi:hypothetical protein